FGVPLTMTISAPNRVGAVYFDGVAGQKIGLLINDSTISSAFAARLTIINPGGSRLVDNEALGSGQFTGEQPDGSLEVQYFFEATLPSTGPYTIVLDPVANTTGSATFTLYNVPPDVIGAINADGIPARITITTPGQNARLTFNGIAGQ